jgi:TrpR-related protein YerC/YecD
MAKLSNRLSKKEVNEMLYQLCVVIAELKNAEEAADLLHDILSYQESEMIAKRLKIAEGLVDGKSYEKIREEIKASPGTIARVQEWLKISGSGYRRAVERLKGIKKPKEDNFSSWSVAKKKYPMYYWPEILLEGIIKSANDREKKRIRDVIEKLDKSKEKSDLFRKIKKLL